MHVTNRVVIQIKIQNVYSQYSAPLLANGEGHLKRLRTHSLDKKGTRREEPTQLQTSTNYQTDKNKIEMSALINLFWALLRISSTTVSGWKGFNFLIHLLMCLFTR